MTAGVNIGVNVEDAAFLAFRNTFKKYREELEKTPQVWARASTGAKSSLTTNESAANAKQRQAMAMAVISKRARRFSPSDHVHV